LTPVGIQTTGLGGHSVSRIAAGDSHNIAVTVDRRIATWGLNSNGQLGNDTFGGSVLIPSLLAAINGDAASGGGAHTLIRSSSALSFGLNTSGQLGNSSTTNASSRVPVTNTGALSGKTITHIDAGENHSLALCSDGTLVGWGSNSSGQIGNNSSSNSNAPVAITTSGTLSGKTPVAIGAGKSHSIAIAAQNVTTRTDDAALVTLTSNTGNWLDPFISGHASYSISVSPTTASIAFTPRTAHPSATVRINGTQVNSGSASASIPLFFGSNNLTIVVTAANGTSTLTYSLLVTRSQPSSDASLASLIPSSGSLSPAFSSQSGAFP
jgi:hypothetical protein